MLGKVPCDFSASTTLADFDASTIALFSFATMGSGVSLGTHMPYQVTISKLGSTVSAIVGTSGSSANRVWVVTASGMSLPL
ncbi:hypothetical protein D3C87_1775260 [compost metagenome]